jgi:hypothetical protein
MADHLRSEPDGAAALLPGTTGPQQEGPSRPRSCSQGGFRLWSAPPPIATVEAYRKGGHKEAVMAIVTQPKPAGASEPPFPQQASRAAIELYWLPLGAGGWFVRLNGRIWEAIHARLEHRRPADLYHTALVVNLPEGRFVVENCWPIPDADGPSRGVVVEGPVASHRLDRWRVFRYEVRRWRDGVIADAAEAVTSPQPLSQDPLLARRLLDLVGSLPRPVWGRDELGVGEMWNSNSVIAWLLARSGLPVSTIKPPAGGRAPGWQAGLVTAYRQQRSDVGGPNKKGHDLSRDPLWPVLSPAGVAAGRRQP